MIHVAFEQSRILFDEFVTIILMTRVRIDGIQNIIYRHHTCRDTLTYSYIYACAMRIQICTCESSCTLIPHANAELFVMNFNISSRRPLLPSRRHTSESLSAFQFIINTCSCRHAASTHQPSLAPRISLERVFTLL